MFGNMGNVSICVLGYSAAMAGTGVAAISAAISGRQAPHPVPAHVAEATVATSRAPAATAAAMRLRPTPMQAQRIGPSSGWSIPARGARLAGPTGAPIRAMMLSRAAITGAGPANSSARTRPSVTKQSVVSARAGSSDRIIWASGRPKRARAMASVPSGGAAGAASSAACPVSVMRRAQ